MEDDRGIYLDGTMECPHCTAGAGHGGTDGSGPAPARTKKRIPYDAWTNSHLSIARHYGGCVIDGVRYTLDYDNAPTNGVGDDAVYFPDLVEE
jgi:hypothetical protein